MIFSALEHTRQFFKSFVFSIVFFSLQIIWFTALFPYFVMITLLVRAVTLEGAGDGLLLYITPDWSKLFTSECWIDSATQIFFAYSIGNVEENKSNCSCKCFKNSRENKPLKHARRLHL